MSDGWNYLPETRNAANAFTAKQIHLQINKIAIVEQLNAKIMIAFVFLPTNGFRLIIIRKMALKWPSMAVYWLFMAIKRSFNLFIFSFCYVLVLIFFVLVSPHSLNKIQNDYTFISIVLEVVHL